MYQRLKVDNDKVTLGYSFCADQSLNIKCSNCDSNLILHKFVGYVNEAKPTGLATAYCPYCKLTSCFDVTDGTITNLRVHDFVELKLPEVAHIDIEDVRTKIKDIQIQPRNSIVVNQHEVLINDKRYLNVEYSDGTTVLFDLIELGIAWFQMSNDTFADIFGIDFTPQKYGIYEECRTAIGKGIEFQLTYDKELLSGMLKSAT